MFFVDIRWHKLVALGSQTVAPSDRCTSTNRRTANTFCRRRHCRCRICALASQSAPTIDRDPHFCKRNGPQIPSSPRTRWISANRRHRCMIVSKADHGSFYRISNIRLVGDEQTETIKITLRRKKLFTKFTIKIRKKMYSLGLHRMSRELRCYCCCCCYCSLMNNNPWLPLDTRCRSYLQLSITDNLFLYIHELFRRIKYHLFDRKIWKCNAPQFTNKFTLSNSVFFDALHTTRYGWLTEFVARKIHRAL